MAYRGPPQYSSPLYVPAFPIYWPQQEQPQFPPVHSARLPGRFPISPGLLGDGPPINFSLPCFPNPQFIPPSNIRNYFPSQHKANSYAPSTPLARRFGAGNPHFQKQFSPRRQSPSGSPKLADPVVFSPHPFGCTDGQDRSSSIEFVLPSPESQISPLTVSPQILSSSTISTTQVSPDCKEETKKDSTSGQDVESTRDTSDTPINSLSRLCRFNRISPIYQLVDEKGPAHLKVFIAKVTMVIAGKPEEYLGEGNSIKKAQHDAASHALQSPNLRELPEKSRQRLDLASAIHTTPVARLNALAIRMRSWADYRDTSSFASPDSFFGGILSYTTVSVYGKVFTGWGASKAASRNMAAQSALDFFELEKERKDARKLEMAAQDTPATRKVTDSTKAPVSVLYEEARRFRLNVSFESSLSDGLPHCQTHHVTCRVGTLESIGQGLSKKDARHDAAEKMLQQLREVFGDFFEETAGLDRRKTANSVKCTKARPDYGKNINPVSRLYQLQQASNQPDPLFLMECPSVRAKDFVVTARIPGGPTVTGMGPNKKLAKRFAAENLMRELGFQVQPLTPLKSSIRLEKPEAVIEDRKVTFDLLNPECEDKANGRIYRKRFSKKPQPASMYPKNSVQEILYEARPAPMRPGHQITPGLVSLPRSGSESPDRDAAAINIGTISTIAREFMTDRHSPTAAQIVSGHVTFQCGEQPNVKDAWLPLLEYLCRVVNMTLKKDTFSRQGPHCQFVTVLTVGEPIESIGCGNGATEDKAVEDAAWNLLTVIGEQGDENDQPIQEISSAENAGKS